MPAPIARAPTSQSPVSCSAASALALNFGIAFVATRFDLGVRSGLSASGFLGAAGAAPSVGSAARKIASASVCAAGALLCAARSARKRASRASSDLPHV